MVVRDTVYVTNIIVMVSVMHNAIYVTVTDVVAKVVVT